LQPEIQNVVAMDAFVAYSIPVKGLNVGIHHFKYTIDPAFFSRFEGTPIEKGEIQIDLVFDKRSNMIVLDFELAGYAMAECDRCTAQIKLPLEGTQQLIVKYTEEEDLQEEEDDEVIFISRDTSAINMATYLYEFAVLALPITNTYDCENDPAPPCNFEVLKYLDQNPDQSDSSNIWDALKGL